MFQDNNMNFSNKNSNEDAQREVNKFIDNAPKHLADKNKGDEISW